MIYLKMLTFWNPVCKKMFRGKVINSFNDMKIKYPKQLEFLDTPVNKCYKMDCCKNTKLSDLE